MELCEYLCRQSARREFRSDLKALIGVEPAEVAEELGVEGGYEPRAYQGYHRMNSSRKQPERGENRYFGSAKSTQHGYMA